MSLMLKGRNGQVYEAIEVAPAASSESSTRPTLQLLDGRALTHHLDNDTYEVHETGEIFTRAEAAGV